jgi:cyclophilin family peptidyl-prolyl cis-trans isomerase
MSTTIAVSSMLVISIILMSLAFAYASDKETSKYVYMETTKGTIYIELFMDSAPISAGNFIKLVDKGFYNALTFHRVEPGFVVQGGDPLGNGSGGPGYTIPDEDSGKKHLYGSLGMAKTSEPNSAGSQFYICLSELPQLDGKYDVFGRVVKGMDVVEKIVVGDQMTKVEEVDYQTIQEILNEK